MLDDFDRPLPLRQVADLPVMYDVPEECDTLGFNSLLGLLKTGQIHAVVSFPALRELVRVPIEHWRRLGPDDLNSLRILRKKGLNGTYKIRLRQVAPEIVDLALRRENGSRITDQALMIELIRQANTLGNVEVLTTEWKRFVSENGLSLGKTEQQGKRAGRPEKNWQAVFAELAARLWLAVERRDSKSPTHETLATDIAQSLTEMGELDVPDAETIKTRLSRIRQRVATLKEAYIKKY